jgi:hypothetical protein
MGSDPIVANKYHLILLALVVWDFEPEGHGRKHSAATQSALEQPTVAAESAVRRVA